MRKLAVIFFMTFAAAVLFLTVKPAFAVHAGMGNLECGSCHTMHSSQGGTMGASMGGVSGSFVLLRTNVGARENMHDFCLSCHAQTGAQAGVLMGTGTTPPKVYLTTDWSESTNGFARVGAGGDFRGAGTYTGGTWTPGLWDDSGDDALGYGHSLGRTTVAPPGNSTTGLATGTAIPVLTCTTCHDPHGTASTNDNINRFRNLKAGTYMPAEAANEWINMLTFGDLVSTYVGAAAGTATTGVRASDGTTLCGNIGGISDCVWPVYRSSGTSNTYQSRAVAVNMVGGAGALQDANDGADATYVGISAFCGQCHGAWHEGVALANKITNDWGRHPVNNQLVDTTTTSGGNVAIVDFSHFTRTYGSLALGRKLPTARMSGGGYTASGASDSGVNQKVFCLSCHYAHASFNLDMLRWRYTSSVLPGAQTALGVASDTGCQQCHNRGGDPGE